MVKLSAQTVRPFWTGLPKKICEENVFWEKETQQSDVAVCKRQTAQSEVCGDAVEWFVKMVEERKHNDDHAKEKKNW